MTVSTIGYRSLLQSELAEVESLMLAVPSAAPAAVRAAVSALIRGGGKRLRPALVLLLAHIHRADASAALPTAAAIEMLHTATLIHDDLIDNADVRRGVETLNATWSPAATVLVGDLMFAHAAELATRSENIHLVRRFAQTLSTICRGELDQLLNGRGSLPTEAAYYERIYSKTASLFGLATEAGPILAGEPAEGCDRARRFGVLLGQAFQIADDVLDFIGSESMLGKPLGSDLRQGLITLPVLHFAETHPDDPRVSAVLSHTAGSAIIASLVHDLRASDAAEWTMARAAAHVEEALNLLVAYPASVYRDALYEIAAFATQRLL